MEKYFLYYHGNTAVYLCKMLIHSVWNDDC